MLLPPLAQTTLRGECMRERLWRTDGWKTSRQDAQSRPEAAHGHDADSDMEKASLVVRQIDRWIASMERLRLADYVRYVDDRKRMFWSSFWSGVARGVGMAVGFTILGAVLVMILQDLARHNLPLIGDMLAQIVDVVQKRLE